MRWLLAAVACVTASCGGGGESQAETIAACLRDAGATAGVNTEAFDELEATPAGVDTDNVNFKTASGLQGVVFVPADPHDGPRLLRLELKTKEFEPRLAVRHRGSIVWTWGRRPLRGDDRLVDRCVADAE
jgi:hypothetical protein